MLISIFKSIKTELATNPIARLMLGIEPRNRKFRRRAKFAILGPSIMLLGIMASFLYPLHQEYRRAITALPLARTSFNWGWELSYKIHVSIVIIAGLIMANRIFDSRRERILHQSYDQWYLAGVSGAEVMRGLLTPVFLGSLGVSAFYFLAHSVLRIVRNDNEWSIRSYAVGLHWMIDPFFWIVGGIVLEHALFVLGIGRVTRIIAVLIFGFTWFHDDLVFNLTKFIPGLYPIYFMIIDNFTSRNWPWGWLVGRFFTYGFRIILVIVVWRVAVKKMSQTEWMEDRLLGNPMR